jgi:multidrug resistance efflux pump
VSARELRDDGDGADSGAGASPEAFVSAVASVRPQTAASSAWAPPEPGALKKIGLIALGLAAIVALLWTWQLPPFGRFTERTENAYVRGQLVTISPQVSGYVADVRVKDFEHVRAGQVLVDIDRRTYEGRVEQARAALASSLATLANSDQSVAGKRAEWVGQGAAVEAARSRLSTATQDHARAASLAAKQLLSTRDLDHASAALREAQAATRQAVAGSEISRQAVRAAQVQRDSLLANVQAAKAALVLARIDLEHTQIRAPASGSVGEVVVRRGQYVTSGTTLVTVAPSGVWVIANFKEGQLARIRPGQAVVVRVDALDGRQFRGTVERLSPATGSEFAVFKPDNATGNFVKVAQRIGVRIALDPSQAGYDELRPGLSVEAIVFLRRTERTAIPTASAASR